MEDGEEGAFGGRRGISIPNGTLVNGKASPPLKGAGQLASDTQSDMAGQIPEIPHFTAGFVSLGMLLSRLSQETFNDLENVINDMAELSVPQPTPNGVTNHTIHQTNSAASGAAEANIQKKLRLLEFTNTWRPKFIKMLVLFQWARRAEEIGKVIDLKLWLDTQEQEYDNSAFEMGQLHRIIATIKEPSPDIETALKVLSLGKASWIPDMGYVQPEPLTPQQILDTLRRINTLLSIRLNLHEQIPLSFRNFSIQSGRVTFRVPEEFEVDLSIADEEPTSQFFFIDFRFIFSPGSQELPLGRVQNDLQGRANERLRHEGLQGLFDFLHNFVLTHKLSILRSQAYEMVRTYWSEHVVVEPVRRSIVVQYWSNKPGAKNWIEVGVNRGVEKRLPYQGTMQRISQIGIRCFRAGKEVNNVGIDLKLGNLSMESLLKQAIALHTSQILQSICGKLGEITLYSSGSLRLKHNTSSAEPTAASLMIQVTASKVIKIMQEPVTGGFAVLPNSTLNSRLEYELNRSGNPAVDGASQISHLRAITAQNEVEEIARTIGWELVRSINPGKEAIRRHFPRGIQQTRFFREPSWGRDWMVAFTTGLEGDLWWVVEISRQTSSSTETATASVSMGPGLKAVFKIPTGPVTSLAFDSSTSGIAQIERNAIGMICQHNDSRHLANEKITHRVQVSTSTTPTFSIYLRYPSNKAPAIIQTRRLTVPWANEIVKLDYQGLDGKRKAALRVASARLNKPTSNLKELISAISTLAVNPVSGAFAFQLSNKVGESCVPELTRRLAATERLFEFASAVKSCKLPFTSASLKHLEFLYAKQPRSLKATIHFPLDSPVRLSLSSPNPHLRILDFLNTRLLSQGLTSLIAVCRMTLPLLTALYAIETRHKSADYEIIARSEQWYEVRYSAPLPKSGFDIRLRTRRQTPMWLISESSLRRGVALENGEEWSGLLKSVTRGKGEKWRGMHGGIVAEVSGVEDVIEKLDDVFRTARPAVSASNTGGEIGAAAGQGGLQRQQVVEID